MDDAHREALRREQVRQSRAILLAMASFVGAMALATLSHAQPSYPSRPVTLVVGYAAGGANDTVARVMAPKLAEALGQPVIVENRTGAAGMIAVVHVAKSNPDGHTLLFAASSMFTTNPVMFKEVTYSLKDFAPISTAVTFPFFVVVSASQPAKSIKDLADYMKANPGKANNSGAAGVHQLAFELFKSQTGAPGEFVGYKGTNEAVAAVMGGQVLMTIADAGGVAPQLQGGKVRALAVTTPKRSAGFPDVPSVMELGYPQMEMASWMGVLAPAGTPAPVVRKLQEEVARIVASAAFKERMAPLYVDPESSTPQEFANLISTGLAQWQGVAKAADIKPK
jgi:tripartite-type tricarboxylate transporter receptor subunit TctC